MGGIVGEDPVPITNLVPSYRFVPTLTSWGETKAARPCTYSTSFRDARTSAYFALRRSATRRSFDRITDRKSADHPSSRWSPGKGWFATRKNWSPTARRRLLGTQPTFTQVPPRMPPSIIKALAPFRSARIAALKAAAPPPRMIRSCRFAICSTFPSSLSNPSARTHRVDSPTERDLWESLGFCAATTTLSAPNVFVIRLVLSEDDFAK